MKKLLAVLSILGTTFVGIEAASAQAQSGPMTEFLCGAKASQQRLLPGSAARRQFIQSCMAAASRPTPEAKPQAPRPVPQPSPAPEKRPRLSSGFQLKK